MNREPLFINFKPPLGLTPRFVRDAERRAEIKSAVIRYMDADIRIPPEWIAEYNELLRKEGGN